MAITLKRIFRKLYSLTLQQLFQKNYTRITIPLNNCKLHIPNESAWAYPNGDYYEENVIHFLDSVIKSYNEPVMIDIGANYGYYSIRYSQLCKQIFSFEPVSKTFTVLTGNIKLNALTNIFPIKMGVSETKGETKINIYNSSGNNSIFERQVPEAHPLKKIATETILLNSLDNLVDTGVVGKPDIIKIDVEGAELFVLKGAKKTIARYRPTILFEYADSTSTDAGYSKEMLLTVLELTDYHIYGIPENEKDFSLIKQDDLDKFNVANLIFIPAEADTYLTGGNS